jgi:hypothetical protein
MNRRLTIDGADREPPYYPALYEFNPPIRSQARPRSRRLILFSLGGRGDSWFFVHLN